jgi:hypothetical protein
MGTVIPKFPNAIADLSWLTIATNQLQTRLAVPCGAADTTLGVVDASRIVQWSLLTLNDGTNGSTVSEIVLVTLPPAGNILTVQRGYDGTTAKAHAAGAIVSGYVVAWHQKSLAAEVAAIEQTLGPNLSNVGVGIPSLLVSSRFAFPPQSPGGNLVVGNNSITLSPVPQGVNGTNTEHWLYISGGTGAAEAVKITGGSAVSGAPTGALIVNCANAHSGAWTIGTATAGIQEAAYSIPASGIYGAGAGQVMISGGWNTVHAPITNPIDRNVTFSGLGPQGTVVQVATDFPLTAQGVFVLRALTIGPPAYTITGAVTDLAIIFTQPDETVFTNYIHWPPGIYTSGTWHPLFQNLEIIAAWVAIKSDAALGPQGGLTIDNCQLSAFRHGIDIDQSFQPTIINATTVDPEGLSNNQILAFFNATPRPIGLYLGRIDALAVTNFVTDAAGAVLHPGLGGTDTGPNGSMVNVWFDLGQFIMLAGSLTIANGNFGTGSAIPAINMLGGKLQLANCAFGTTFAHPVIETNVAAGYNANQYPAALEISNSYFHTFGVDTAAISAAIAGAYAGTFTLTLTGNVFARNPDIVFAVPTVSIGPGKIVVVASGNSWPTHPGSGSGFSLYLTDDQPHAIGLNSFNGWSLRTPATLQKASIAAPAVNSTTAVASAATITPTGPLFHVTGAVAISGIPTPAGFPYTSFVMIPDGAFTLVASPTIGKSSAAVVGQAMVMTRDAATGVWYPSY